MIIQSQEPDKRIVENYDFWFQNGQVMTMQVDELAGDTIDFVTHPTAVRIHLAPKPHRTNPEKVIPEEDITIFVSHIMTVIKKIETVQPLTSEQQVAWQKTVQEISKTTKLM